MAHVKAGAKSRQATVETLTDALIAEFLNTVVDRLAFADERIAHA